MHQSPEAIDDALPPADPRTPRRPVSSTMAQAAAEQLRDLIAQGALPPGERLRERALAARLAVSRTPLREALRILAAEGLVEISANRGAVVANPGLAEIHDLLVLLGALEALAGEQAVSRATDREIEQIGALHREMLEAFTHGDRLTYYKRNQEIHRAIVAASKNAALIQTHARINARVYRVRFVSNHRDERWQGAVDKHEEILAALTTRDGAALATILREHLGQAWTNVREQESDHADS